MPSRTVNVVRPKMAIDRYFRLRFRVWPQPMLRSARHATASLAGGHWQPDHKYPGPPPAGPRFPFLAFGIGKRGIFCFPAQIENQGEWELGISGSASGNAASCLGALGGHGPAGLARASRFSPPRLVPASAGRGRSLSPWRVKLGRRTSVQSDDWPASTSHLGT